TLFPYTTLFRSPVAGAPKCSSVVKPRCTATECQGRGVLRLKQSPGPIGHYCIVEDDSTGAYQDHCPPILQCARVQTQAERICEREFGAWRDERSSASAHQSLRPHGIAVNCQRAGARQGRRLRAAEAEIATVSVATDGDCYVVGNPHAIVLVRNQVG